MSIDPNTLPEGAVVEANAKGGAALGPMTVRYIVPTDTITRVFVPVPDGMTHDEAVAALADAGAWVEVGPFAEVPMGARYRYGRRKGEFDGVGGYVVHRDDLPPTDPDAELVEKMARANFELAWPGCDWATWADHTKDRYRTRASAVLAVVREHEATR